MALGPSAAVLRKMDALAKTVSGSQLRATLTDVGVESKKRIEREVVRDFGADLGMSNWRRGRVVKLRSGFEQPSDDTVVFTARPGGPWMVAEQGRRAGGAPSRTRRGRTRKSPSTWGSSRGKRTWTRSQTMIRREAPKVFIRVQRRKMLDAFKS